MQERKLRTTPTTPQNVEIDNRKYGYITGENDSHTAFLRATATVMGQFGQLPIALRPKYHELLHLLMSQGLTHLDDEWPSTEAQFKALLKSNGRELSESQHFDKLLAKRCTLTQAQKMTKRGKVKSFCMKKHGFAKHEVEDIMKRYGDSILNLVPSQVAQLLELEHGQFTDSSRIK